MIKKHIKQMTKEEVEILTDKVKDIAEKDLVLSEHAIERIEQKNVDKRQLKKLLNHFTVVEYKYYNPSYYRIVIRSRKHKKGENTCAVLDNKGNIITVWKNQENFKHSNVDLSKYNANLKVFV